MSVSQEKWKEGLPEEIAFWDDWLAGRSPYPEDRALRLSSRRHFPHWARYLIPTRTRKIRVLDVGAGPVTALGDVWEGREVSIVPIDPLAPQYEAVLQRYGIIPPTPTRYGLGEKLLDQFKRNSFEFAYACNCLDHALDPVECYRQMLAVLQPGCSLVTFHESNEGEHQGYAGLHQWNFSVENGRLVVWNRENRFDLVNECSAAAEFLIDEDRHYIKFTLTKKANP